MRKETWLKLKNVAAGYWVQQVSTQICNPKRLATKERECPQKRVALLQHEG